VSARSYLSIGDVLTLLRQEFPDVTISKIRFLESQGLVNPERTPSGYRKFYEHDVERLRWVLRQQREHFLPLKVIKDRLDDDTGGATVAATPSPAPVAAGTSSATVAADPPAADPPVEVVGPVPGTVEPEPVADAASGLPGIETAARHRAPATVGAAVGSSPAVATGAAPAPVERAHRASLATQATPTPVRAAETQAANGTGNGATARAKSGHVAPAASAAPAPKPHKAPARRAAAPATAPTAAPAAASSPTRGTGAGGTGTVAGSGGASLSLDELCGASGLSAEDIGHLQEFGLLTSTVAAGVEFFDGEALDVASVAAKFAAFGVEARHLRLYKNAADREAGFIEQIVIPMVRQRNPEARARATQTAEELARLGQQLKASLLRTALHDIL